MSIPVRADGTLEQGAAQTSPGDYVELRAELDALAPGPLAVELL